MGMRRTRWGRVGLAAGALAVLAGASTAATGPSAGQEAGCEPPYLPIYEYSTASGQTTPVQAYPEQPVSPPPLEGASLDLLAQAQEAGPDTDGDGRPDTVDATPDGGVAVTRGDGVVRITPRAGTVVFTTAASTGFDLDGDGLDELLLVERDDPGGTSSTFLLPGATAVGSHRVADVAVQVPDGPVLGVGDQLGGPGEDLLVPAGGSAGATAGVITSGDLALAPGPGGTLAAYEPGSDLIDQGQPTGLLDLGDGPPTLALFRNDAGHDTVTLWDEGTVTEYRTAVFRGAASLQVTAYEAGGRTYLLGTEGNRSGVFRSVWDLTDPCAVPADVITSPAVPAAPGADPVAGSPGYTG